MTNYKTGKNFKFSIKVICNDCNTEMDLNPNFVGKKEEAEDHVPLAAKSSNTSIFCPKCHTSNFRVFTQYDNYKKGD